MKKLIFLAGVALLAACATKPQEMPTEANVDLQRYAGTWYEQARLPNRFQSDCTDDVHAEYVVRDDGTIGVTNVCRKADGSMKSAQGEGRMADIGGVRDPARLEVRFAPKWTSWLPMVWGDYWIIRLEGDYQYSLVGTPDRTYLWVLSRDQNANPDTVKQLLDYAGTLGFAVDDVMVHQ